MTPHDLTGAQPALFLSRARGSLTFLAEDVEAVVGGWLVSFVAARVVVWNFDKKIGGTLGRPISMN